MTYLPHSPLPTQASQLAELKSVSNPSAQNLYKTAASPKTLKWSDRQHILYILFLETNRQRIKSKLIRRSNAFFKDMAEFIGNKTGAQCRNHHQKYEAKYKYPHRIIKEEKEKVDLPLYETVRHSHSHVIGADSQVDKAPTNTQNEKLRNVVDVREASCQTDLSGIDNIVLMQAHPQYGPVVKNEYFPIYPYQRYPDWYSQWGMLDQMERHCRGRSF